MRSLPHGADVLSTPGVQSIGRIVYVCPTRLDPGQADVIQVAETGAALTRLGFEVHVLCRGTQCRNDVSFFESLRIEEDGRFSLHALERLGKDAVIHRWKQRRFLHEWLDRLCADGRAVLYLRSLRSEFVIEQILAGRRKWNVPFVFEVHAIVHRDPKAEGIRDAKLPRLTRLEKHVIANADAIVANGPLTAADCGELGAKSSVVVIQNGVREVAPGPRLCERDIDLVYVGSLQDWKGIDRVIEALGGLTDRRLVIAGEGDERVIVGLKELAKKMGVDGRVEFVGHVPRGNVFELLRRARCAIVPLAASGASALRYTCPIKLLEAAMVETPIVVADRPSVRSLVGDVQGFWFDRFEDKTSLANTLRLVLDGGIEVESRVEKARAWVSQLTWDERAQKLARLFASLPQVGAKS